jgi:Ca-activated chloride channel family protein
MRVPLAAIALLIAAASVSSLAQQPTAPPPAAPAAGQAPVPAAGQALEPAPAPPQTGPTPQAPAFRSGVDLVSLNVTVTDGTGRYVTDLKESEFNVFEDGVKQDVTFFTSRKNPIALSMLLDSSASMENKLPILQAAATTFVRRLQPSDMASIIEFDSTITVRQKFTSNQGDLERAIQLLHSGGSTAMNNAIYFALKDLKKLQQTMAAEENPRRQALVVFSDGQDTYSIMPYEDVLDLAKRSETAIYTIGLRDPIGNTRGFNNAEFVLRQLAVETGGRAYFPDSITDLTNVYAQIADELSNQYALGYTSKNPRRDGAWRRVIVQATRPSLTSRTKLGYFAPTNR